MVRRATPFVVIVAVFAIQVGAEMTPVLAFPLYLAAVLMAALYLGRLDALAAGLLAALAIAGPSIALGETTGDTTSAVLLAAVLVVVAVAVHEVVGRIQVRPPTRPRSWRKPRLKRSDFGSPSRRRRSAWL